MKSLDLKDNSGSTALDLARHYGQSEVVSLMERHYDQSEVVSLMERPCQTLSDGPHRCCKKNDLRCIQTSSGFDESQHSLLSHNSAIVDVNNVTETS